MDARTLLARKRKHMRPVTIGGGQSVSAAAHMLVGKGIGALLILGANEKIIGIFTERDFLRQVVDKGGVVLTKRVCEVMTRKVVTVRPHCTAQEMEKIMTDGKFRHLPVVDANDIPMGMISSGDITKWRADAAEAERDATIRYSVLGGDGACEAAEVRVP